MKRTMLLIVAALLLCAIPATTAAAQCQACVEHSYWPWLDDCWWCEAAYCGAVLCHIEEYAPGQEICVTEGDFCGEGNPICDHAEHQGLLQPGLIQPRESTKLAKNCEPPRILSETWRLARVEIQTPSRSRRHRQNGA
jgi:hypothetical protein